VIEAHGGQVDGVAVSPDGGTLLTTGNHEAALWDLRTGKLLRRRSWGGKDQWPLSHPVFVSGGKEVACEYRNEILILDARTLKTRATLKPQLLDDSASVNYLAVSPDGARLAVAVARTLAVYDVASGKETWHAALGRPASENYVRRAAFSPDGKVVAAAVEHREPARLHDAGTGRELPRPAEPPRKSLWDLAGLAYSRDGRALYGALWRTSGLCVWDVATGERTATWAWKPEGKDAFAGSDSLAISPDGKTLACAGSDGRIRMFEPATGGVRHVLPSARTNQAYYLVFCPDGRLVRPDWPKAGRVAVSDWRRDAAKAGRLSEEDLKRAWEDLGSKDAEAGFRAVSRLLAAPERQALALLARLPRPLTDKQIARRIADLDDDDPDVRETATQDLEHAGSGAEKALRTALAKPPSLEVKRRATAILKRFTPLRPQRLRFLRAVEVLEAIASPAALKQLERLAGGAAGAEDTEDARAALERARKALR
jgi:hypothetical protein